MIQTLPLLVSGLLALTGPLPSTCPLPEPSATHVPSTGGAAVEFETRDRLALHATYFRSSKKGRNPAVVLVHDAGKDRNGLAEVAEYLQKKGIGVLTVDVRGHGETASEEQSWSKLQDDRARASLWSFAAGDVRTAMDWLRDQDDVHSSRVGIVGVGAGSALALAEAMDDRDTMAVALVAPGTEHHGYNLMRTLADLGGLPTLIVSPKEARDEAERMQASAHHANGGEEYVSISVLKSSKDEVLTDSKLGRELARWLDDSLDPSN